MNITFTNCTSIYEQAAFWLLPIAILMTIVSFFMVFVNENVPKSKWLLFEVLGPLHPIISSKYLNEKGKKWRPVLIFSLLCIITDAIVFKLFNVCN